MRNQLTVIEGYYASVRIESDAVLELKLFSIHVMQKTQTINI